MDIFALVNFSVLALSAVFCSGLPTWSTDNLCSLQWRIVQQGPQTQITPSARWGLTK